ncbi:OmpP1/FadL family transporter [Helicobacter kayseriensis]|uniref:OmpP1/FadL family transporter n=1 Tax=Helicobacter kayseriensis TaxID=2905877 RepID=UPI001E31FC46|nr:outer membrane protein transport protein [Helicobacter kayseriensis]MCE3046605.1 outer membrane protein transport protein [Helicobacter kayseriensis]MCE3048093.1 outer membrane protein transport protein [Helicobacter kayseriensis]
MKKPALVVLSGACFVLGSGFKLNEHSLNSIALSSAYVAGANGADSALYNPANMGMGKFSNKHEIEISTTWLHVPRFDFTTDFTKIKNEIGRDQGVQTVCTPENWLGNITCAIASSQLPNIAPSASKADGSANATHFVYPEIFYKSPSFYGFNVGLSVTAPSGMTIDWDGEGGKFLDSSFIAMIEANPVLSFKIANWLSIAGGGRVIYGMGKFQNSLYVPYQASMFQNIAGGKITITSKGTTAVDQISDTQGWGYGWNVAMTLKPFYAWNQGFTISATYRSPVHIDLEGKLSAKARTGTEENPLITADMDADLTLSTDIPPILQVGISQQLGSFLVEFVYERNFWSYGDKFEFNYKNQKFSNISGSQAHQIGSTEAERVAYIEKMMGGADYDAVAIGRGWKDTNSYRLGVTYGVGQKFRAMASIAYDETPVPSDAFGIPDADGYMVGVGARYSMFNDSLDVGAAYSMTFKDNRKSPIQSKDGWGKLQLVNVSMACRF